MQGLHGPHLLQMCWQGLRSVREEVGADGSEISHPAVIWFGVMPVVWVMSAVPFIVPPASSVLFDRSALSALSGTSLTSATFTISLNVGSGSNGTANRALLCALMFPGVSGGTSTAPAMTWDGVSMTQVGGPFSDGTGAFGGTVGDIYFFGLVAPALGSKVLAASWTGANQAIAAALSVVGASQVGGTTTFHNAAGNNNGGVASDPATITVATALSSEITMAAFMADNGYGTAGNTDIGHDNGGALFAAAADWAAGASPTLTYARGSNQIWEAAAVAIKAA